MSNSLQPDLAPDLAPVLSPPAGATREPEGKTDQKPAAVPRTIDELLASETDMPEAVDCVLALDDPDSIIDTQVVIPGDVHARMLLCDRHIKAMADTAPIKTPEDYQRVLDQGRDLKTWQKEIERHEKPMTDLYRKPLDALYGYFRPRRQALDKAIAHAKRLLIDRDREVAAAAREEQARLDAAARRWQEELQQRANKHRDAGREEMADALEANLANVAAPVVVSAPIPSAKGAARKTTNVGEVADMKALIKLAAKAKSPVPEGLLVVDPDKLKKWVALEGKAVEEKTGGAIKVREESSIALRSR